MRTEFVRIANCAPVGYRVHLRRNRCHRSDPRSWPCCSSSVARWPRGSRSLRSRRRRPPPPRLTERCHLFTIADLDKDRDLVTADRSSEVGQWVAAREGEGWALQGVDFEIGQKSTGYPQGFLHVCMARPAS